MSESELKQLQTLLHRLLTPTDNPDNAAHQLGCIYVTLDYAIANDADRLTLVTDALDSISVR